MSFTASWCCCGLQSCWSLYLVFFVLLLLYSAARVSTRRLRTWNKRKPLMWIFCPAPLVNEFRRRLEQKGACRRGRRAQIHTNTSSMRRQILPQLARAAFSNTAVSVWAKLLVGAVCPTGCSTINSSPSISQSLTNATLFSAARSHCFSSEASHCHFAALKLPECSNSELCPLKDPTAVYFCTIIQKLTGAF